mgnify:CR=1 FL=1
MDKATFEKGREIRSSVLGKEFVDAAFKAADSFSMPMQELVTEYCWGAVWGREGLDKKQRSMLNLAMISCLNRPHELRLHIAGALKNGVSRDEIREIFMQVAIYAGVPAGVDSFRYDASDQMPGDVNQAFWTGTLDFVGAPDTLTDILTTIEGVADTAYPSS